MNSLVTQYFREGPNFEKVIFLSDHVDIRWKDIIEKSPDFPRGWFELNRISVENRIHFTYDFWLDKLPFNANIHPVLTAFFDRLDDVGIVLHWKKEVWVPELIYSLRDNSSFFRGLTGASQSDLEEIKVNAGFLLPRDYLAFMKIHNGFGQLSQMGLLKADALGEAKRRLTEMILKTDQVVKSGPISVDPSALCPFYEVYGLNSFQCFYEDWYPNSEMGNVYFSGIDYTVSDTSLQRAWSENLAFSTFLEWFIDYLEGMSLSL